MAKLIAGIGGDPELPQKMLTEAGSTAPINRILQVSESEPHDQGFLETSARQISRGLSYRVTSASELPPILKPAHP